MSGGVLRKLALALVGLLAACTDSRHAAEPAPVTARRPESTASTGGSAGVSRGPLAASIPPLAGDGGTGTAGSPAGGAPPTAVTSAELAAAAAPSPTAPSTAPSPAAPSSADLELAPALLAVDGTPLSQTRERPDTGSAGFRRRLELLVEAIAHDDPERALPAFFPVVAYELVKAIPNPSRDWETRLVRAFRRDIHDYHRLLGPEAAGVQLAGIATNEGAVRWMDPGAEGNRVGYYRVTRSRLKLRLANGTTRELELTSLISWRGAWYVVHLHGFS